MVTPYVELKAVSKYFGTVIALKDVTFDVLPGEVHCLLGDNGAGKSTLIKTLSGVYTPDAGEILVDGKPVRFGSPKETLDSGIATVYQDLALVPLMSVARNFFLGREPVKGIGPFKQLDIDYCNRTAYRELRDMGIELRDPEQPVGTLSGGERQCLAIARAIHFGAKVLILDEPTSALGVHQASIVLKLIVQSKARGIGVIFISHNVHHAYVVGDRFTILKRGRSMGTHSVDKISRDELLNLMAGGKELVDLEAEIEKLKQAKVSA
ncbi:ATP-binding cassette domain-containing protein [Aestuariivirga litoralis]|uniref:ATP-binding cassette domain-containing protein n=1 Tax=Aestuariivirga litoralis TaxID=2650924 RepID=UPI0018C7F93F|nr:ATP-binding cassette domain-containing protein [Aestuariivirga litoralis]MBG1232389.1 sugar ABC transporter ATP-binding protein [Aestuariivirga litoralis]